MTFATNMKATAARLLAFYGDQVSVVRTLSGAFNLTDGSVDTSQQMIYQGYGNSDTYNVMEVNNVTVLSTDTKFTFSSDTQPLVGDVITLDGVDLRIMKVDTDSAQGMDIVYTLQLRV